MSDLWEREADASSTSVGYYDANGTGWTAHVKWDGCTELRFDHADIDSDHHVHICDLDTWIERLTELRDKAAKHFGPDWPR